MKYFIFIFFSFQFINVFAQVDSIKKITFSGYIDMYYSYDFSNPDNHEKSNFIYNHKRHNEINTNLLLGKVTYFDNNIKANLGLIAGNYAQYNLSSEPNWAQFIYEANIGVKLSKKHNLWLDAGIMPSHIGFESAISADCWTLTRSILAENSPYYETGIKIGFTNKKENLNLAFLVLNGWQKISMPDNIQKPSIGFQFNYKPQENLVLNYSNFIGTDKADSLNSLRTYHNFYLQYSDKKKFALILGFDLGTDKINLQDYGVWFSPVAIVKYEFSKKINIALRGEYYFDKNQIIVPTNTLNGFQVSGISTNLDYRINNNAVWRIEGKIFNSKDEIFLNNSKNNFSITSNLTLKI